MNPSHYQEKKHFRIYALTQEGEGSCAYVGKTTGRRLSAIYSRHVTGAVAATEGDFDQGEKPRMHLLEELFVSTAEAYCHTLAWAYIFEEFGGYALLNSNGTYRHVVHLQPETKAIVDELCQEPLEEVLKRTYLAKPSEGDLPPESVPETEAPDRKSIQMNVRINREDKAVFDQFCKTEGISQREGFSVLLDQAAKDRKNEALLSLSRSQKATIRDQEKQIRELEEKLLAYESGEGSQHERRLKEKLARMREGINTYLKLLLPQQPGGATLPEGKYRRYTRFFNTGDKPVYPAEEGFYVLELERILWSNGRSPCFFLIGTGEDGQCCKLRCYPKADHVGLHIRDSVYAKPGAQWLLGCQRSNDGAMDLIAAFPLPESVGGEEQRAVPERHRNTLDDLIGSAEKRR